MTDTDMLYMASLEKRNEELEAKVAELDGKHWNECGQIAHYDDELRKAKRLLKVAVDDVRYCMRSYDPCEVCTLLEENGECVAADDNDCSEKYKWRYEAEALALIGEDTNVPASADDTNVVHKSGGWISCKDKMPEDNTSVLFVYVSENGIKSVHYGYHQTLKGIGSSWAKPSGGWQYWDDDVTHWQPVPEPPKDGDNSEN